MRALVLILTFGLFVASVGEVASAVTPTKSKTKKVKVSKTAGTKVSPRKDQGHLQTDVKFDDSVLHGQYQTPEESLAKVENEKGLNDLIGVRKHFKDRLATAADQE